MLRPKPIDFDRNLTEPTPKLHKLAVGVLSAIIILTTILVLVWIIPA